ncbi:MAG TPA: GH3 auxin-responsive promoter family protein [Chitinophagales bacterium]|nr:GH3 auxin-responsive promoter family protein [Chitinophagales bacterium]
MGIKSLLTPFLAKVLSSQIEYNAQNAVKHQQQWLLKLLSQARNTQFGQEHGFSAVANYAQFTQQVPIRDYEQMRPYIDKVVNGQPDVLWQGKPVYFAKTSGTTSGAKFIPITKQSIGNHFNSARDAMMLYTHQTGNSRYADGRLIYLSGSPELEMKNGIYMGRLSGIVNHHIPAWWRSNQLPSYATNCIDDWETKVEKIALEAIGADVRLVSGIPPWVQMFFDVVMQKTGKKVAQVFPNLSVLVHGGVNFEPYRAKLFHSLGKPVDTVETFPASEGFIAYQYRPNAEGLLLNTNSGLFFEFVPVNEINNPNPRRLQLAEVETGVNYALLINSNAGLWGYNIGDTVKFLSVNPPLITVTGRVKHYISAFGEHVIAEEVEQAMQQVSGKYGAKIAEFTVAPNFRPESEKSYHEWLVAFDGLPNDLTRFAADLDHAMQQKNTYYADLIQGNILQPLKITPLLPDAFIQYMKSVGKLGGQNKVPRLSNNRQIADALLIYKV